jgi:hypothetical protein
MSFRKQVSLHGLRAFLTKDDDLVARNAHATGGEGKPSIILPGSPDTVAIFDDFLGDLVGDEWAAVEGSDTGTNAGIVTGTNGVYRITDSVTVAGTGPDVRVGALTQGLMKQWKADMGKGSMKSDRRLRLTARVKLESVTRTVDGGRTHAFIGFSDSGGGEFPVFDTGAGMISQAADAVGFVFSPGGDTGWSCVAAKSVAGDSGDQLVVAGSSYGPSANTYTTLEVEIRSGLSDSGSSAFFFVDGKPVGRIASPVASNVALTPWIGAAGQDTGDAAGKFFDIDYINVAGSRDTGL